MTAHIVVVAPVAQRDAVEEALGSLTGQSISLTASLALEGAEAASHSGGAWFATVHEAALLVGEDWEESIIVSARESGAGHFDTVLADNGLARFVSAEDAMF
jgi:uncharacterized protein (DUF2336 family)